MNETPERICEALEWLAGHKWAYNGTKNGKPSFACSDGYQALSWDSEDGYCLRRGWAKRNIEEEFAHALAVTAPWEWTRSSTGHWHGYGGERDDVVSAGLYEKTTPVPWWWNIGTMKHEDSAPDVDTAQRAARAAYLCWMRGRFAMKGCMA